MNIRGTIMNDGLEMGFWDREYSSEEELAKTQSTLENGVENGLYGFSGPFSVYECH